MISLIFAIAQNNIIGKDNKLPWHISGDLKRFKEITSGKKIIMGRKTFLSLPKLLPNRHHIICTKNKDFKIDGNDVTMCYDFDDLLKKYEISEDEVFIIGGAEIYKKALPYCDKMYITEILRDFLGDTSLDLDYSDFEIESESEIITDEKTNIEYKFLIYSRKNNFEIKEIILKSEK